uniref:Alpha-conotoxin-like Qc1.2 n=2 Tax=Conus quercinus TaxID=101313 RepID=CA12_CONQU|nr:RecName: Full=Alpha-conotoxin-like Qc1.2; AltName: Full=Qu-3; Flags: Precursor [Conus quercinus]AAS93423.1 alpha conotoxin qc1.2 [Conus quercinus]
MGMRMMFTVFLLVALATTVASFTLDRASNGRNAAADDKPSDWIALAIKQCCANPPCKHVNCR